MKKKSQNAALAELFCSIQDPKDMKQFLDGFMTASEIDHLWERWRIIELLLEGQSQRSVKSNLEVSIATVSRGAHVLKSHAALMRKIKESLD